jgi:PAS domain S-box-containing protein
MNLRYFKELWLLISNLGIDDKTPAKMAGKIGASNKVYFASAIVMAISLVVNTTLGPPVLNLILTGWFTLLCTGLILNYYKQVNASRVLFVIWTNAAVVVMSMILDRGTMSGAFLFVNLVSLFVLFDIKERISIVTGLILSVAASLIIFFTRDVKTYVIPATENFVIALRVMNVLSALTLSTGYLFWLMFQNSRFYDRLEQEKEISRSILNASSDSIWLIDHHYKLLSFNNRAAEGLRNLNGTELRTGLNIVEIIEALGMGHSVTVWRDLCVKAVAEGHVNEEIKFKHPRGTAYLDVTLSPFRREGEREFCIAIFIKNITAKKAAEADLLKYHQLINQSSDIMLLLEADTYRISDMNECALASLGYTREELSGKAFTGIKKPVNGLAWVDFIQNIANETSLYECNLICKNGREIPVESNVSVIQHEDSRYILVVARDVSKRKQDEQKIIEQREYLDQIINTSPNLIWVKDADGRYKMVNKAMAEAYKSNPGDMIGKRDSDFGLDYDEVSFYNQVDKEVLQTLRTSNYYDESLTHPLTGVKRWFNIIKAPIKSANEYEVLGIAIDISDRKKLEIEVKELNILQKAIIDGTENSIISTDMDGFITSFNKNSEELLGYSAAEVIGKVKPSLFLDKQEFYNRSLELSSEFGRPIEPGLEALTIKANMGISERRNWTIVRKNGTTFTASCLLSLMKDAEGKHIGYLIVSSDVTEKIRIENQLQKAAEEEKKQAYLNGGIARLSDELRRHFKNAENTYRKALSFLVQYTGAHQGCLFISDDEDAGALNLSTSYAMGLNPHFQKKIQIGEGLIGQAAIDRNTILLDNLQESFVNIQTAGGAVNPKYIAIIPLVFEDTVRGVLEIASVGDMAETAMEFLQLAASVLAATLDLDSRKAHTEKLLAESQELNSRLQEQEEELMRQKDELIQFNQAIKDKARQLELRNTDLENARTALKLKAEELEINNRYKSEFLANMSHELRTPLNSILILSNLLAENPESNLNDKQLQFAEVIHRSGSDLLSLINDVLDLAKIEAGKIELVKEPFDLSLVAEDMRLMFQEVANEKGIAFAIKQEAQLPKDYLNDRIRIGQILKNLLSNAFKFTPAGGDVALTLDMAGADYACSRAELKSKQKIVIRVSDTGIGIPKEKQQLIFEAFSQADGSTSRQYGGTGLGLSISRELAYMAGGEIQLKSEEGRGSVFTLLLPLEMSEETQAPLPTGMDVVLPEQLQQIRVNEEDSRKILIIEDDPRYALALKRLAASRNLMAEITESGEQGLAKMQKEEFAAILLDIQLPGMDGWKVLQQIKDDAKLKNIPVHIMSANDYAQQSSEAGAQGFMLKSVDELGKFKALFDRLNRELPSEKCRALIIEDNLTESEQVKALLPARFASSDIALTGQYALELLRKNKYDLIVLDLNLPDTNGVDLLRKIKAIKRHASSKIIVYTGLALDDQMRQELQQYSDTIIQKSSSSYEELIKETNTFLQRITATAEKIIEREPSDLSGARVLMVDDDMRNIFALSYVLESKGIEVLVANDGREAIDMLKIHPDVDAVLLDMMMPVMEGYEAIRIIRSMPGLKKLPVIALTANAMKGDRERCLKAGMSDYLSKPVSGEDVISTLRKWIVKQEISKLTT